MFNINGASRFSSFSLLICILSSPFFHWQFAGKSTINDEEGGNSDTEP